MIPSLSSAPATVQHAAPPTVERAAHALRWLACAALPRTGVAALGVGLLWALAAWAMHGGQ
tara:strand:- start:16 stop:198 length:183 start_codon:yes stop_codon:yes gene_type:complete